ncbi:MAG: D-2-hydroxyacid dehydrogenase [Alphaproteobacteria bacterium]|nr:D-2-hydroxyacid dehydrogenase [Alphaproteobacteria bacterium]
MAEKLKILVENRRGAGETFEVDPRRFADAASRHPAVAARIETEFSYDGNRFDAAIGTADMLIGWQLPVPFKDLPRLAPRMKLLHLTGAGINHLLPLDWKPDTLTITNNRGVHAPKAGEFAAMAVMMLHSRMPALMTHQRAHRWQEEFTPLLAGRTVAIVGVGHMGGAAAEALKKWNVRIVGVRRTAQPHPAVDEMLGPDGLDRALAEADIVLVTTPLTSRTRHLIGARELDLMKPGAALVNIGRGGVVDYEALRQRLASGRIGGAILDVFEPEPLPADSALWDTPNLIITPHCSSDDIQQYVPRTLDLVFDNLERLLAGKKLRCVVDPALEY